MRKQVVLVTVSIWLSAALGKPLWSSPRLVSSPEAWHNSEVWAKGVSIAAVQKFGFMELTSSALIMKEAHGKHWKEKPGILPPRILIMYKPNASSKMNAQFELVVTV